MLYYWYGVYADSGIPLDLDQSFWVIERYTAFQLIILLVFNVSFSGAAVMIGYWVDKRRQEHQTK